MDNDNNFNKRDSFEQKYTQAFPDFEQMRQGTYYQYGNPQVKPKCKKPVLLIVFAIVVPLLCLLILTSVIFGRGWIANRFFDVERVHINIPIQKKPDIEEKYFDKETGKYTTEGIAKKVLPSVVSIEIYEKGLSFTPSSQGSGIILTENGYIITNAHVIENASWAIKVILNDGKEYQGKIVGADTRTDLAVIKINANGLVAADFGDSEELVIGEQIVALGSPAGLYGSLTRGVVSGLNRMIKTEQKNIEMNCIQIDAAINPGNSGGALVNMYGQVVGINTSKYASEVYDGIGFAISFNAAKPIIEQLIAEGYIKDRFKIGIVFYEITELSAQSEGIKPGLLIKEIDKSCDIANSGLMENDVITHINGVPVVYRTDVDKVLNGKKPGEKVKATVYRKDASGKESTFEIEFMLMQDKSGLIEASETDSKNN